MRSPIKRRVIVASCVHGRVGAFYAPCAGDGNQICRFKCSNPWRRSADTPPTNRFNDAFTVAPTLDCNTIIALIAAQYPCGDLKSLVT
jgi:hypothetical protein